MRAHAARDSPAEWVTSRSPQCAHVQWTTEAHTAEPGLARPAAVSVQLWEEPRWDVVVVQNFGLIILFEFLQISQTENIVNVCNSCAVKSVISTVCGDIITTFLTKTAFRSCSDWAKNLWPNFNWWLAPSLKALVPWCRVPEMGTPSPRKPAIWGAWRIVIKNPQACPPTPTTHRCRYQHPDHYTFYIRPQCKDLHITKKRHWYPLFKCLSDICLETLRTWKKFQSFHRHQHVGLPIEINYGVSKFWQNL